MTICAFFTHLALYMFDHEQEEAALADMSAQVLIYSYVLTSHTYMCVDIIHTHVLPGKHQQIFTHAHAHAYGYPFPFKCVTCFMHMCDKTHFASVAWCSHAGNFAIVCSLPCACRMLMARFTCVT